jgi:hypothetical protein
MRVVSFLVLAGCSVGGGPILGYGQRGLYGGVDASIGGDALIPQLTLGYQSDHQLAYVRLDEAVDGVAWGIATSNGPAHLGGRVGGGLGWAFDHSVEEQAQTGVFVSGLSYGVTLGSGTCNTTVPVAVLEVQVRYARGWSIALAPRIEAALKGCVGDGGE